MTAHLRGARLAPIARALRLPLRYPDGEIDADLHATGAANAPQVAGNLRIPVGSLNGLNFHDAGVGIAGNRSEVAVHDGAVTVGTTHITFSADVGAALQRMALRAPRVNLADFNDYFDAADTLAGRGHASVNASRSDAGVRTTGNIAIADVRYRRFALGDVATAWHTRGRTVDGVAGVRSDHGTLDLTAAATLPASDPLRDAARRTSVVANGSITALDLAQWLPAAEIVLPVAGTLDGSAHASGSLAAPSFTVTAALSNGVVQRYPITALTIAVSGNARAARFTAAHFAGPGLSADASGRFGYGSHDPIAIALHAQSDDIGVLAKTLGAKLDVGGTLTTTVDVGGTRNAPRIAQTLDATDLRAGRYILPHAHAELASDPQTLVLRAFEANLEPGVLLANATLPIELSPTPRVRNAPPQRDAARAGRRSRAVREALAQRFKTWRHH